MTLAPDIQAWVDKAVKYNDGSENQLKQSCFACAQVVGKYSEATQQIAKRIHRSVSTVENRAHAWWMVEAIGGDVSETLWETLPASHFWSAWEKIHQAGYEALPYLKSTMENGWSGKDMLMEFDRDVKAGNAPIQYKRAVHSLRGLAEELQFKHQLNQAQWDATMAVLDAFPAAPAEVKENA